MIILLKFVLKWLCYGEYPVFSNIVHFGGKSNFIPFRIFGNNVDLQNSCKNFEISSINNSIGISEGNYSSSINLTNVSKYLLDSDENSCDFGKDLYNFEPWYIRGILIELWRFPPESLQFPYWYLIFNIPTWISAFLPDRIDYKVSTYQMKYKILIRNSRNWTQKIFWRTFSISQAESDIFE